MKHPNTTDVGNSGHESGAFWNESRFVPIRRMFQPRFDVINFMLPKRRFWMAERTFGNVFYKYFQRVSTRFGLGSFENAFPNVGSAFQNLRLGSINFGE